MFQGVNNQKLVVNGKRHSYTSVDIDWEMRLERIRELDEELHKYFERGMKVDKNLSRKLVSFQANKNCSQFRWYKYKEAFSADIVKYFLEKYESQGSVFDPFAGAGTTLFAAEELGYVTDGIELLPIGQQIIKARQIASGGLDDGHIERLKIWRDKKLWKKASLGDGLPTLRITERAYPKETEDSIRRYLKAIESEQAEVADLLLFALLCVLESISYTRKDGQYLRWDYRSGRRQGQNTFNKGEILPFDKAIFHKLGQIIHDITVKDRTLFDLTSDKIKKQGSICFTPGSCLELLPHMRAGRYAAIFTSPPYCNRYDYTRTYALELAILGISEKWLSDLRQQMISCTVENREKDLLAINKSWVKAIKACNKVELLQEILNYLEWMKKKKKLNNNGIPRMVRGYFYEMACVIQECYRLLKKNGIMFMVNDNVRYAGASVSVDLILSYVADQLGFAVENIFVLPNGKGNSSQQMGAHGRKVLRKCVYVWRKSD